jgi:hypothetical protein
MLEECEKTLERYKPELQALQAPIKNEPGENNTMFHVSMFHKPPDTTELRGRFLTGRAGILPTDICTPLMSCRKLRNAL